MATIWRLHSPARMPAAPCEEQSRQDPGPRCETGLARSWSELADFERPLLLRLLDEAQDAAATVLLGIDGGSAQLLAGDSLQRVPLPQIAPYWTGEYRFFWQPPDGFDQPLAIWSDSPAVAEVARLFAQLDGQAEPLAGSVFNRALDNRVRLFQQNQGLTVDGVVGRQTLLKLNRALGIDPSAAELLTNWEGP